MVSKIICLFRGHKKRKTTYIGQGTYTVYVICDRCGKRFYDEFEYKYTTPIWQKHHW